MKVLFDCRSVFPGMGGIGRASAALARALPRAAPDVSWIFLFGRRRPPCPLVQTDNALELTVDSSMLDPAFEQLQIPALLDEHGVDVYHGACFAVPLAGAACRVATVHDVVFRRRPDLVDRPLREYLDRWTGVACDVAEAVITVSEFSRAEISALYGRPFERIDVVPNAVDPEFFGLERRPRAGAPYVLSVGALEPKKNVVALLHGFAALAQAVPALPHRLVLAGGAGGQVLDLEAALLELPSAVRARIDHQGHVPEPELHALLAGADAFAYLSEYEGFGLPPLEAMAVGIPTVVSDRGALPEVTAGGALVVDPHDVSAVAGALERLLSDDLLRRHLRRRGQAAATRTSWAASAQALVALYRRVVGGAPAALAGRAG